MHSALVELKMVADVFSKSIVIVTDIVTYLVCNRIPPMQMGISQFISGRRCCGKLQESSNPT